MRLVCAAMCQDAEYYINHTFTVSNLQFNKIAPRSWTRRDLAMKTPPEKHWKQRKAGAMKKAHDMHWTFGARVALYLERDGELFVYRSHEDFGWEAANFLATQIVTPSNFITLAQDNSRQYQQSTPVPTGPDLLETPASTPDSLANSVNVVNTPCRTRSQVSTYFDITN